MVGGDQVYSGGTLQNLNNPIPAGSPYQINYATAINNNGQIVANAYDTRRGPIPSCRAGNHWRRSCP